MSAASWSPGSKRVGRYYRFPAEDFVRYFSTPVLPDSATDKLAADRGTASSKLPFADKARGKLEEVARKMDSASRFGLRTTSFLLLLSEYLTLACDEDSVVPADIYLFIYFITLCTGIKITKYNNKSIYKENA